NEAFANRSLPEQMQAWPAAEYHIGLVQGAPGDSLVGLFVGEFVCVSGLLFRWAHGDGCVDATVLDGFLGHVSPFRSAASRGLPASRGGALPDPVERFEGGCDGGGVERCDGQ